MKSRKDETNQSVDKIIVDFFSRELNLGNLSLSDNLIKAVDIERLRFLIDKINNNLSINLSLRDIKENPRMVQVIRTIKDLYFQKGCAKGYTIRPTVKRKYYPLSYSQKRFWVLNKIDSNSPFYNINFIKEVSGPLNILIFKKSLLALVVRHESLRTNFQEVNEGPVQTIGGKKRIKIDNFFQIVDLSEEKNKISQKKQQDSVIKKQFQRPYNITTDSLFRITLIKKVETNNNPKNNQYVLAMTTHHIISDGWSIDIFYKELSIIYNAYLKNQEPDLSPLPIQYKDYAVWEQSEENSQRIKKQEKYWLERLKGELPVLNLPIDKPRPPTQTYHGLTEYISLDKKTTKDIKEVSSKTNTTLFAFLLSVFYVFLYRITGQTDIVVGTPVANRKINEVSGVVGLFLNNLLLRLDLSGNPTFTTILKRAKQAVVEALDHGELPFEYLLEKLNPVRDMSQSPIFNAMFQFDAKPKKIYHFSGLRLRSGDDFNSTSKLDFKIKALEVKDAQIIFSCEYSTDIFFTETIKRFLGMIKTMTMDITKNPNKKISDLEIMTEKEKHKIIYELNSAKKKYRKQKTLGQLFAERAKKSPEAIAVRHKKDQVTYKELNEMATRLAGRLKISGIKRNEVAAIATGRNIGLVVAVLAVHKVGGCCLLLDESYPEKRIEYMLKDSRTGVMITGKTKKKYKFRGRVINIDDSDTDEQGGKEADGGISPDDLAFLIYTSGSEGKPKGVMLSHKNLAHNAYYRINEFKITSRDILCLSVPTGFLPSIYNMYLSLIAGSELVIYSEDIVKNPYELFRNIDADRVSVLEISVQILNLYLDQVETGEGKKPDLKSLRFFWTAGEKDPPSLVRKFYRQYEHIQYIIGYGSSEYSMILNNKLPYNPDITHVSEGRPGANAQVYILDDNMNPVPAGIVGNIYVSGDGLTPGYWRDPFKNKKLFSSNPFLKGEKIFKTGDIGKMGTDYKIEVLGRRDQQVKLRGHRIELGEIEVNLKKYAGIKNCVAMLDRAGPEVFLTAYYTGKEFAANRLGDYLKEIIPAYMVPQYFIHLEKIPLTAHNKIDRAALLLPQKDGAIRAKKSTPKTAVEKLLYKIWQEALGTKNISVYDNFFSIGGNSIKIIRVYNKLKKGYNKKITIASLFSHPTISQLAQYLQSLEGVQKNFWIKNNDSQTENLVNIDRALKGEDGDKIIKNIAYYNELNKKIDKLIDKKQSYVQEGFNNKIK